MTPQEPHPQHCEHEEICRFYAHDLRRISEIGLPCLRNYGHPSNCTYDSRATHTPAQPAQQRIDAAIKELEKEIADQKELIATTDGHHKEIHESILNTLEFAIALLREGERG